MTVKGRIFYGWIIVAISLVIMTATYAVFQSWPVFYVAILDEFGWGRGETALIFSTAAMVYTFSCPISGLLFDRFGPRRMFSIAAVLITIGLVAMSRASTIGQLALFYACFIAIGTAFSGFVPNLALVSAWFEKRRATAGGIAQMGTRDSFMLSPLIQLSIAALGWRSSYLVMAAALAIINIPLAQFLRARPQVMGLLPDGNTEVEREKEGEKAKDDYRIVDREWVATEWTWRRAIKEYRFWAFFLLLVGVGLSVTALINHFVAMMTDVGYTAEFAASLLLMYAITSILGRSCGFISDIIGRESTCTLCVAMMLFSFVFLLITKDTSAPWMLYVFIFFFGFGGGMLSPSFAAGAADLFQGRWFGAIFGTANMGFGLTSSIGTWLYGYIYDINGTYSLAIVIAMLALCVTGVSIWVAAPRKVRRVSGRRVPRP